MNASKLLILPLALAIAACSPSAPEPDATATPAAAAPAAVETPAPAPAPEVAAAPTGLWFEPAGLSACGTSKDVVTVNWDATATPGVNAVQIVVLNADGTEGMFAATGAKGSKATGPWMGANKAMVMRDATTGAELARASVAAIPCDK